ncbi:MAG: NUDIX domain-containing protein [Deltaproteobacteria bacterium]
MHSTDNEILEVVDTADNVIGRATRAEIHRRGLIHRAVHILLFNSAGEIYVQRRSALKDRFPRRLDSSAAGHVDPGESYEQSARRELEEELGIMVDIEEVLRLPASEITDNEHVVVYQARSDLEPSLNPDEIQWGGFMAPGTLTALMAERPDDFVPVFIHLWNEYRGGGH